VAQGKITADLRGKTTEPAAERVLDMYGFLDAIEDNIKG
jgi:isocitrate dehydrogenase